MNLFGEFTCGRKDQSAHLSRGTRSQPLQDGKDEGCSLAGAGLRQPHYIASLKDDGDGLPLDWCWYGETGCLDGSGDFRIERKLFEIQ